MLNGCGHVGRSDKDCIICCGNGVPARDGNTTSGQCEVRKCERETTSGRRRDLIAESVTATLCEVLGVEGESDILVYIKMLNREISRTGAEDGIGSNDRFKLSIIE